ncbi:hypothetical protein GLOIN_2v528075 [Rhizophagus irregularis DAOM 181602=DAOM 197198]|nr:hypothetical protein GLOIN_2v528075 [Rhizophagus irregularis DAOM 181602=DAOM 197198]GBC36109.2 hypothetical protein GLOIN_2v528075 [Rhizophagus irregularis DAOM 181602=DAOM 197198]
MSCNWLLVGKTHFCEKSARDQYCASHAFKIRKGVIIPQPCKGCGRGTKSRVQLCVQCGQESDIHRTVLNILTGRWVKTNEDIGTIYVGEFELDPLADFYYPALILPLSILASRSDIHKNFPISVESAVVGGMSLFSLEKNKRSSFQNLMLMNYSNLSTLIGITWDREETKAWRNDILMKFLHHPNLVPSKYRPNSLYDAFTKTSVLGPEHILALSRI